VRVMTARHPARGEARAGRVLFLHPDADLRAVVARLLEREGYRVHTGAHAGHALLLCRTTEFDLVVTELSAPDWSGPDIVEGLRRHCPGVSTVYVANQPCCEHSDSVLVRPFTGDELIQRIQSILDPSSGRRTVTSSAS
jgi:DNA-binding response OmpR family regulator